MNTPALLFGLGLIAPQAPDETVEVIGRPVVLPALIEVSVGRDISRQLTAQNDGQIGAVTLRVGERDALLVSGPAVLLDTPKKGGSTFEHEAPPEAGGELSIAAAKLKRGITLQIAIDDTFVAIRVQRDWRGLMWGSCSGWRFDLEETTVTYLDSNLSGRLDRSDHVIYGDRHVATPFHPWIVDGKVVHKDLRILPPAGLRYRSEPIPSAGAQKAEVDVWNGLRLAHGVPPAVFAADRVEACEMHARYIGLHGAGHDEDPSLPGYSDEGRSAGMTSCITFTGMRGAALGFLAQLYHRAAIVDPKHSRLQGGGVGSTWLLGGIDSVVVAGGNGGGAIAQRFPAPGASFLIGSYTLEHPRNPAYDESSDLGLPVTLRFTGGAVPRPESATLHEVRGRLDKGKVGKEVACMLSYPDHNVPVGYEHAFKTVALTPLGTLKHGAYQAEFRFAGGATYRWRFSVGR